MREGGTEGGREREKTPAQAKEERERCLCVCVRERERERERERFVSAYLSVSECISKGEYICVHTHTHAKARGVAHAKAHGVSCASTQQRGRQDGYAHGHFSKASKGA